MDNCTEKGAAGSRTVEWEGRLMRRERLTHTFGPVFDGRSRILILGSFPSVLSRAEGFYYGNPRNRFWNVMAILTDRPVPKDRAEKEALLLESGAALWDVLGECAIEGSSDASIRGEKPNDLMTVLGAAPVERIFLNGAAADRLYRKHLAGGIGLPAVRLPSTSPANAAWSLERLAAAWTEAGVGELLRRGV